MIKTFFNSHTKHITTTNVITGIIILSIIWPIKLTFYDLLENNIMNQFNPALLTSFILLITRLAIKGLVEQYITPFFNEYVSA